MTVIKNMAYWRAKSGNSPLKAEPVKASSLTIEQQIAQANKKFGPGVKVQPKTSTTDIYGKQLPGVEADARTAYFSTMGAGAGSWGKQSYKTKTKYRKQALAKKKSPAKAGIQHTYKAHTHDRSSGGGGRGRGVDSAKSKKK